MLFIRVSMAASVSLWNECLPDFMSGMMGVVRMTKPLILTILSISVLVNVDLGKGLA